MEAETGAQNYNPVTTWWNVADSSDPVEITRLVKAWGQGDAAALDRLTPLVYGHLRRLAHAYMRKERPGQTLQATAPVNEAFVRLVDARHVAWQDRAHFFACAHA